MLHAIACQMAFCSSGMDRTWAGLYALDNLMAVQAVQLKVQVDASRCHSDLVQRHRMADAARSAALPSTGCSMSAAPRERWATSATGGAAEWLSAGRLDSAAAPSCGKRGRLRLRERAETNRRAEPGSMPCCLKGCSIAAPAASCLEQIGT